MQARVALVTGTNRGIGYEIARQLAAAGLKVVAAARDPNAGASAVRDLAAAGHVEFEQLDVTDPANIQRAVGNIVARHGRIDVLINNAGVLLDPRGTRLLDAEVATFRATFEVNFYGPLQLVQQVLPHMRKNRYGRIVNVSSTLGQLAEMGTGTPAYRVSKAALNALTCIVAAETEGSGILVNTMSPGWVRTRMGGEQADRSPEQGADTAVWLATLPDDGPTGGFFKDRRRIPW